MTCQCRYTQGNWYILFWYYFYLIGIQIFFNRIQKIFARNWCFNIEFGIKDLKSIKDKIKLHFINGDHPYLILLLEI